MPQNRSIPVGSFEPTRLIVSSVSVPDWIQFYFTFKKFILATIYKLLRPSIWTYGYPYDMTVSSLSANHSPEHLVVSCVLVSYFILKVEQPAATASSWWPRQMPKIGFPGWVAITRLTDSTVLLHIYKTYSMNSCISDNNFIQRMKGLHLKICLLEKKYLWYKDNQKSTFYIIIRKRSTWIYFYF